MSRAATNVSRKKRVTVVDLVKAKEEGRKLSMITCYDASFARLIERSAIDCVLVGDSLGNVMLGYDDTIPVTVDDMVHHTAAVSRVLKRPFLVADMPFMSYKVSIEQAMIAATRLVQEGGAHAVKIEGGAEVCPQLEAIVAAGIPVIGHLGFTPQSVHNIGGYRVQGRAEQGQRLMNDADAIANAGASMIVLELVPSQLATAISREVRPPTIGIGAGAGCDGQVLVLQDMLGFDNEFSPKFLKKFANVGEVVETALAAFDDDVKGGHYPNKEHEYE